MAAEVPGSSVGMVLAIPDRVSAAMDIRGRIDCWFWGDLDMKKAACEGRLFCCSEMLFI